ncbi:tyrosine-type recombinase/integrase [Brevibacillus nitrificans]|uniref:tyrosine-type recombinase/integrase n=1 Tax=Brevibacillus nitrificans TaxID=651560 RepID=UPI002857A3B2|nr:tyrosine-type recombinase/integrase [Brevibacillus nitrificans]MDR7315333.1 integrase/recombinase XerD [Brevibacillus nitrificans]
MINQKNFDLPDYTGKFIRYLQRQGYSTETITGYKKDLEQFEDFLLQMYKGNILTEEIQKGDILDFLDDLEKRGLKTSSRARALSTLKSFNKFLVYELHFKENVAGQIRHPKLEKQRPDILSHDEIQSFMNTAKIHYPYEYVLFSLLYYTGSRLSPIRTLQRGAIDLDERKIFLDKTKGGKNIAVPLHDKVVPILEEFLQLHRNNGSFFVFPSLKSLDKPISPAHIRGKMKKTAALAGISKRVYPHLFRHCMATRLTTLGVGQLQLARLMGHADTRPTERYQHLHVEDLRSPINLL